MQEMVTITLSPEDQEALDELTHQSGISHDELVSKAVKEYIFLRRFRQLRERMLLNAQDQGIYTDQDVFHRVS